MYNTQLTVKLSIEDRHRLNRLCEYYKLKRPELIRFLIETYYKYAFRDDEMWGEL